MAGEAVERVARALCTDDAIKRVLTDRKWHGKLQSEQLDEIQRRVDEAWPLYEARARLAIEALRDPPHVVLVRMQEASEVEAGYCTLDDQLVHWRAGIDALLR